MQSTHIQKNVAFDDAKKLLQEGDVLLFEGVGISSFIIKHLGEGKYSHAGIASSVTTNGDIIWECIEFREKTGGRSVNLKSYLSQKNIKIDVFRPVSSKKIVIWVDNTLQEKEIPFNGRRVTTAMRKMTGLPYGWRRLLWIAKHEMPFLRFFYNIQTLIDDNTQRLIYPVCSTAVSYSFSTIGYDLTHHKSDNYMEPSDIARSALLFYIFTLIP